MVVKDIPLTENLVMDNNRNSNASSGVATAATTTFTHHNRRRFTMSMTTAFLLASFFICSLLAVGLIVYSFSHCDSLTAAPGEEIVCTSVNLRHMKSSHGGGEGNDKEPKYDRDVRLPRSIKPLKYNITLVPQLSGDFNFEGRVQIWIRILQDTYNITMHSEDLNITRNDVAVYRVLNNQMNSLNNSLNIRKQYLVGTKQFFIIELYDKLLKDGEYMVDIKFNGIIQDYLQGFYRSSYNVLNETRWLAFTQFQATDARRAFPCFDEPALKANFTLHIARPSNMTTISNMPIVSTNKHATLTNYMWDHFAESVPMSTYLVAYAISDFTHISSGNFSVWARADAIKSAEYALSIGPKILTFLQDFFNVKFPLPKIDMIALPDFQAGAMENWGLITFRETAMLYEKGVATASKMQHVAAVVGHELAHQWFGNLVTPSWWSDIWLNEGFASFMEYLTIDAIAPEWKVLEQFVVNELQTVFQLDALSSSHKISYEVFNPQEISEIFDRISYAKGSTIIRMMKHFLTDAVFRRGLSKYLREMAYSAATQDDLWRFLTNEAKISGLLDNTTSVKAIMDTWTLQTGFPVVMITRHPNSNAVRLEQNRFIYTKSTKSTDENPLWWIPITFTTANELNFENTRPTTWMPPRKTYELENRNLATAKWFIFNIKQTGYYRVNYDLDNWHAIMQHMMDVKRFEDITPSNRAQLLDDAMNLARGSYLSYGTAMNMTRYLAHETDHVPWKAAITNFNFIDMMFVNTGEYDYLKNYLLKLLSKVYNEVGFEDAHDDDMLMILKRSEIVNMACHLGHRECISECIRHFQNWLQTPNPDTNNPISPNLRGIVYCSAIQYGTEYEWDFAFERYLKTSISAEKELLLSAMGCSKEPWILYRYLRRAIDRKQHIRKQDVLRVFGAVANTAVGQQIAFDFIRSNWQFINIYLGSYFSNIHTLLKLTTKRMNSRFQLEEFEKFVRDAEWDLDRPIRQIVEHISTSLDWMNRNYKPIVLWLQKESGEAATAATNNTKLS